MLDDTNNMKRTLDYRIAEISEQLNRGILIDNWTPEQALLCLSSLENWIDHFDRISRLTHTVCFHERKSTEAAHNAINHVLSLSRDIAIKRELDDALSVLETAKESNHLEASIAEIGIDNLEKYRRYLINIPSTDQETYRAIIDASNLSLKSAIESLLTAFEETESEKIEHFKALSCKQIIEFLKKLINPDELGSRFNTEKTEYYIRRLKALLELIVSKTQEEVKKLLNAKNDGTLDSILEGMSESEKEILEENMKYAISFDYYRIIVKFLTGTKTVEKVDKTLDFQPQKP